MTRTPSKHLRGLVATAATAALLLTATSASATDAATRADAATSLADLAVGVRGAIAGLPFTDTTADDPAAALHALGVATGRPDGSFGGDVAVTRGQLAALAARLLAELRDAPLPAGGAGFTDVGGTAHASGIVAAAADELVLGYADGTFRPDRPATQAHLQAVADRLRGVLVTEGLLAGDPLPDPVIATFDTPDGSFRVLLDRPAAVNHVAGAEPGTHIGIPNGRILPGDGGVNTGHTWHLVDVEFAEVAMEVCDGSANYIDRVGLDSWYETQGDRYCPWGAIYLGSEPAGT